MLTVMNVRCLALAALLGTSVAGTVAPATADSLSPRRAAAVPCGDVTALIQEINQANSRGSGVISLTPGCDYPLSGPAQPSGPNGPNGLPAITGILVISGASASITRATGTPFRIAEVAAGGSSRSTGSPWRTAAQRRPRRRPAAASSHKGPWH